MELPKIDMNSLPDLTDSVGLFGTLSDAATAGLDDRIVIIMVFIYDLV